MRLYIRNEHPSIVLIAVLLGALLVPAKALHHTESSVLWESAKKQLLWGIPWLPFLGQSSQLEEYPFWLVGLETQIQRRQLGCPAC